MERSAAHVPDLDHNAGPETTYAQLDSKLDVACGLITRALCLTGREALYHDCALDETCSLTGGSFKIRGGCYFFLARQRGSMGHTVVVLTCVTTMEA
jgi:hypothetical protein